MRLIGAELLKVATTRLLLWYALALLAFLAFVLSTRIGSDRPESLELISMQRSIFETAGLAAVFSVLVGAILVTAEYAHGTINQSFLAAPRRERLLAAKLVAALVVGAGIGLFADGLTLLITQLWYGGRGLKLDLGADDVLAPLLGALGASLLAAAIGVGLGALLRRQGAATALILVWLLIGEATIGVIGEGARYAPGHALASVVTAHTQPGTNTLGVWGGVATAFAYATLFLAAGAAAAIAADVPSSGD